MFICAYAYVQDTHTHVGMGATIGTYVLTAYTVMAYIVMATIGYGKVFW